MPGDRWVCLDVGETLVDETRIWQTWARVMGVTPLTLMGAMGAAIARSGDFRDAFAMVGRPDWERYRGAVAEAFGGFAQGDLYADALPALDALRDAGYRVAIIANQPAERGRELRALGIDAEVMAMSDEMGLHKPQPEFFTRSLELLGDVEARDVAYVGDRPDNDVAPASAAGMRAVWLRRGPWAAIWGSAPEAALVIDSLDELVARIAEAWPLHSGAG